MDDIKKALTLFYKNILTGLKESLGDTCKVMPYDANRSIDANEMAYCELDLVRWEEVEDANHNHFNTRLLCHWEIRILDRHRTGENKNLAVHVRSLAMGVHMLIRKNTWGLDFVGMPGDIVCEDDKIDEKLTQEEQWLISFSQEISIGEEESYYDSSVFDHEDMPQSDPAKVRIDRDEERKRREKEKLK